MDISSTSAIESAKAIEAEWFLAVAVTELPNEWEDVRELSPRERTVRNFAYSLLGLIAFITILILGDWIVRAPTFNVPSDKAAIENLKMLNAVSIDRAKEMFDLVVVKALLPVFATVVGVLVGRRAGPES